MAALVVREESREHFLQMKLIGRSLVEGWLRLELNSTMEPLQVQEICDRAKEEFVQFINSTAGPKDLVIQSKQLMSLLEHVTPMKVLRK